MPAGPVGSVWASGSWSATAWEQNTWANASAVSGIRAGGYPSWQAAVIAGSVCLLLAAPAHGQPIPTREITAHVR